MEVKLSQLDKKYKKKVSFIKIQHKSQHSVILFFLRGDQNESKSRNDEWNILLAYISHCYFCSIRITKKQQSNETQNSPWLVTHNYHSFCDTFWLYRDFDQWKQKIKTKLKDCCTEIIENRPLVTNSEMIDFTLFCSPSYKIINFGCSHFSSFLNSKHTQLIYFWYMILCLSKSFSCAPLNVIQSTFTWNSKLSLTPLFAYFSHSHFIA